MEIPQDRKELAVKILHMVQEGFEVGLYQCEHCTNWGISAHWAHNMTLDCPYCGQSMKIREKKMEELEF